MADWAGRGEARRVDEWLRIRLVRKEALSDNHFPWPMLFQINFLYILNGINEHLNE